MHRNDGVGKVLGREDGRNAGQRACGRRVDGDDPRVGVRTSHEGDVKHARQRDVIGEDAAAGGPDPAAFRHGRVFSKPTPSGRTLVLECQDYQGRKYFDTAFFSNAAVPSGGSTAPAALGTVFVPDR